MAVSQISHERVQTQDRLQKIAVRITSESNRFASGPELTWQRRKGSSIGLIVLNPNRKYQEILGFGAALTDAACSLLAKLAPEERRRFLRETFDASGMALNTCRVSIGASDYATELFSYCDQGPDPELKNFSIDHDRAYVLPILREVRELCPDLFLLASPWSPPGWMKANGSMLGGSVRRPHFPAYADYFLKFLDSYAAEGVPVDAVTVQNEVDTDQDGLMPACLWGQESETRFIAEHLGPKLAARNVSPKIWLLDHNYNLWGRALSQLSDPRLSSYVEGVAWHGYAGQPESMTSVHSVHPAKHAYWTEGGPEHLHDATYQTDWVFWGERFTNILRNWARCIITWNLALDENGRPNIGPFECGGVVTIDSRTGHIIPSGLYWALKHYSFAVRRGAWRIESRSALKALSHAVFANPDGTYAAVLTNAGRDRLVRLRMSGQEADIELPANSVVTLTWAS